MASRRSPPPPASEPKSGGSSKGNGPDAMAGGSLLPTDARGQTPQAGAGPEVGRDPGDAADPVKPGDAPTSVGPTVGGAGLFGAVSMGPSVRIPGSAVAGQFGVYSPQLTGMAGGGYFASASTLGMPPAIVAAIGPGAVPGPGGGGGNRGGQGPLGRRSKTDELLDSLDDDADPESDDPLGLDVDAPPAIGDCFRFFAFGGSVAVPVVPRPSPPPPAPEPKSAGSSKRKGSDAMAGGSLLPTDARGQTPQAGAGPEVGRDPGDGAEPVKPGDAPTSVGPTAGGAGLFGPLSMGPSIRIPGSAMAGQFGVYSPQLTGDGRRRLIRRRSHAWDARGDRESVRAWSRDRTGCAVEWSRAQNCGTGLRERRRPVGL